VSATATVLDRVRRDPVWFCRTVLGFEPWSKQRAVLEAVRDHRRVAVRSAHGVGKTAIAARLVLWYLAAFPGSNVITTASTWTQVREQLWRELTVAYYASGGFFTGTLTDTRLELGPDWFALGLSTDRPEAFAGYHAERLLVVIDEASGVDEAVWEAAESLLTTAGSRLFGIGNPLRPSGPFYRAFTSERELYRLLSISALDSPAVTGESVPGKVLARLVGPDWIEGRRVAWGEGSPLWQARVLGEFPTTADDTVVSIREVEAAQSRRLPAGEPVVVACDVARFGSDETVIAVRRGSRVRIARAYVGRDLMQTTGAIVDVGRELVRDGVTAHAITYMVDDAGVGGGVTDRLRELGYPAVAFNAGGRAALADMYPNRRSEAWWTFAEQLPQIDLDPDERLAADLVAPRYKLDSQGRRKVEAKAETKRRLGRSPDRGDAVLMAFAAPAPLDLGGELERLRERAIARDDVAFLEWGGPPPPEDFSLSDDLMERPL
jgi:hypothetical protein